MCLGIRMVKNDKDREMYMKNFVVSLFNVRWFLYFRMKSMVVFIEYLIYIFKINICLLLIFVDGLRIFVI